MSHDLQAPFNLNLGIPFGTILVSSVTENITICGNRIESEAQSFHGIINFLSIVN